MSSRKTILSVIQPTEAQPSGRLPVALLSGGTWSFLQKGLDLKDVLEKPELAAPVLEEVNQTVQSDIIWPGSGYHNLPVHVFGGKLKFREHGNIDIIQSAFASLADLDKAEVSLLDKHPWIVSVRQMIQEVNQRSGAEYLIGTSSWGPFTLAGQFYGVENLLGGLYKDKAGIRALLDFITELCYQYLAPAIVRGAKLISIAEPTASGDLISRRHFDEFVAPYLQKLIARLKQDGALIALHICGNIQDRVGLAPDLGVDLLSVDFKVDLSKAAHELAGRTALAGNLNPVLLREGTPDSIARETTRILQEAGNWPRFVLMPGCDVPARVPLENLQTFFAIGRQWQKSAA
nr:uroporphyrinogen decarboxylase family protein [uncultured Anaeromusa sp.]